MNPDAGAQTLEEPERARIARLLERRRPFPPVRTLEPLGAGDFCMAWLLNGREVVRVARHDAAARALAREACVLPAIAGRLPAVVPRPVFDDGGDDGVAFAVHERVAGVELTAELWRVLPEPARADLPRALGAFLAALHAIDPTVGASCRVPAMDHRADAVRLRTRLAATPGALPDALRDAIDDRLARWLDDGVGRAGLEPRLLNADVSPGHVLVDLEHGEITGIIDWGDVVIGDPARDFIFLYEDWGSEFLDLALDAYPAEPREDLVPRVHRLWLMDQLDWTLRAASDGREADAGQGSAALEQGLHDMDDDG